MYSSFGIDVSFWMTSGNIRVDKDPISIIESVTGVNCFGVLVISPTVVSAITFGVDLNMIFSETPIRTGIVFPLLFLSSVAEKYLKIGLY